VPITHDLYQIIPVCGYQHLQSPTVQDQQLHFAHLTQNFLVNAVGPGLGQCQQ